MYGCVILCEPVDQVENWQAEVETYVGPASAKLLSCCSDGQDLADGSTGQSSCGCFVLPGCTVMLGLVRMQSAWCCCAED